MIIHRNTMICKIFVSLMRMGPAPTTCTINTDFSPAQKERLHSALTALQKNKIICTGQTTDLFPAHISTSFFVHLLNDPVTMLPKAVGFGAGKRGKGGEELRVFTWVIEETSAHAERQQIWRDFSACFLKHWQEVVEHNGAVGAPIDGGLLALLAAAGGAYFVARKKKNKQQ